MPRDILPTARDLRLLESLLLASSASIASIASPRQSLHSLAALSPTAAASSSSPRSSLSALHLLQAQASSFHSQPSISVHNQFEPISDHARPIAMRSSESTTSQSFQSTAFDRRSLFEETGPSGAGPPIENLNSDASSSSSFSMHLRSSVMTATLGSSSFEYQYIPFPGLNTIQAFGSTGLTNNRSDLPFYQNILTTSRSHPVSVMAGTASNRRNILTAFHPRIAIPFHQRVLAAPIMPLLGSVNESTFHSHTSVVQTYNNGAQDTSYFIPPGLALSAEPIQDPIHLNQIQQHQRQTASLLQESVEDTLEPSPLHSITLTNSFHDLSLSLLFHSMSGLSHSHGEEVSGPEGDVWEGGVAQVASAAEEMMTRRNRSSSRPLPDDHVPMVTQAGQASEAAESY